MHQSKVCIVYEWRRDTSKVYNGNYGSTNQLNNPLIDFNTLQSIDWFSKVHQSIDWLTKQFIDWLINLINQLLGM